MAATELLARPKADTAQRILDAAFACFGDQGLSRTTMEDVAKRAGITRQTVYRYFPSKDHLVMALVLREEDRFIDGTRRAFAREGSLEDALYHGTLYCLRFAREHPLLDQLLRSDAASLLPYLTTRAGPLIKRAREAFLQEVGRKAWVRANVSEQVADLAVRMTLSYALTPPDRPVDRVAKDMARILTIALTGKEAKR
jgi:AcrR family transcriptional regulator